MANSLLKKEVAVNLLCQVLNVLWANPHLGKVQLPSVGHFQHTHHRIRHRILPIAKPLATAVKQHFIQNPLLNKKQRSAKLGRIGLAQQCLNQ